MCKQFANDLKVNNAHQVAEALGDYNRYFANRYYQEHFGRNATDDECLIYYVNHGGAEGHRQRVKKHNT